MNLQTRYMYIASGINFYTLPKYNVTLDLILIVLHITVQKYKYELHTGNDGGTLLMQ